MKNFILHFAIIVLFTSCSEESKFLIDETYENGNKKSIEVSKGNRVIKKVYYSKNGFEKSVEIFNQQNLVSRWLAGGESFSGEEFNEYFGNGSLKRSGYYIDDKMNGEWSYYDRDNHLETERYFFNDEPTSIWVWYNNNGDVYKMQDFGTIKSNGQFIEYYLSGQVKRASFYNNGSLDGMHVTYHENGRVKSSGQYRDGYQFT